LLDRILGVLADALFKRIERRLDAYLSKWTQLNATFEEKEKQASEIKEEINLAQSEEERSAALNKLYDFVTANINPR
jgi:archaellum component FlaC